MVGVRGPSPAGALRPPATSPPRGEVKSRERSPELMPPDEQRTVAGC